MNTLVVATHVWPAEDKTPRACDVLELDFGGPIGDRHHGLTMKSDTRQKEFFARGTEIRNHRQISIVDLAELATIAQSMGIATIAPGLIADNICTEGIDSLTQLPRMTRLIFDGGAVIMLGGENFPCTIAGAMIGSVHGTAPEKFPKAAMGLRGVTGWVEHPGVVRPGMAIDVQIP